MAGSRLMSYRTSTIEDRVIKLFKTWWHILAYDPLRSRRLVRALLVGFGVSSAGLVQLIPDSRWRIPVYMLGGIAGCLGGLLSVGEPNPK